MNFSISSFNPLISLVVGILILVFPRALNYLIAFYLIVSGLMGLGIVSFG
jgi:hypothetical protein